MGIGVQKGEKQIDKIVFIENYRGIRKFQWKNGRYEGQNGSGCLAIEQNAETERVFIGYL